MSGWAGQSLRQTTGTIYYTRGMTEKGNKSSTTLPQLLTAAWRKGGSGCSSSSLTCLFLFALSVRTAKHNSILNVLPWRVATALMIVYDHIWPRLMTDVLHICWENSSEQKEELGWYLPCAGKWIAAMFMYYVLATLIINSSSSTMKNERMCSKNSPLLLPPAVTLLSVQL